MLPLPIILNRPLRVLFYFAQYAKLFCAGLCCEVPGEGQTLHITHAPVPGAPAPKDPQVKKDEFFWLNAVNRATVVTGLRNGQFGEDLARRAAAGIAAVEARGEADPSLRVKSYIAWEPMFIEAAGQGVTAIHAGRSSQDILSTQRTAILRDAALKFAAGLEDVIGDLLALADRHRDTIVPSYTNGVARPAHLLRPLSARHRRLAPARARAPLRIPRPLQPVRHGRHRSQRHGLAA